MTTRWAARRLAVRAWLVPAAFGVVICAPARIEPVSAREGLSPPTVAAEASVPEVTASVATTRVSHDVDDPAVWVHPADGERSLILGTVKVAAPDGALVVYSLNGGILQVVAGLDRPNNVDVEYGFELGGRSVDLVVVTERLRRSLRLFRIADDGRGVVELGSVRVLDGQSGDDGAPMGIGLYRRASDRRMFAIVAPKHGDRQNYLWQYLLQDDGKGRVRATLVRRFGAFSGSEEIEAVAVDDELGYVYFADERSGIRKWHANPDHPDAARELAHFGRDGFRGDREGIGIYALSGGTGYIVCTDQLPGRSEYRLYRREGRPGNPHDHEAPVKVVRGNGDSTDGVEVTSSPLGAGLRNGALIAMNSRGRNFLIFPWEQVALNGSPSLHVARAIGTRTR